MCCVKIKLKKEHVQSTIIDSYYKINHCRILREILFLKCLILPHKLLCKAIKMIRVEEFVL